MLKQRVLSAVVFVPLVLGAACLGGIISDIFFGATVIYGAFELCRLLRSMGYYVNRPVIIGGVTLFMLQRFFFAHFEYSDLVITLIIIASAVMSLLRYEKGDVQAPLTFGLHIAGILYLGWLGGYFLSVQDLPSGNLWLMVCMILIWMADLGAYSFGRRYGRHKMTPRLSPHKSWEGYFGGMATSLLVSVILSLIATSAGWLKELTIPAALGLSLLISALTPLGDVFISMLKRVAGVKDSGHLIPGHGGILDRFDTWIWAVMITFYFVKLIT